MNTIFVNQSRILDTRVKDATFDGKMAPKMQQSALLKHSSMKTRTFSPKRIALNVTAAISLVLLAHPAGAVAQSQFKTRTELVRLRDTAANELGELTAAEQRKIAVYRSKLNPPLTQPVQSAASTAGSSNPALQPAKTTLPKKEMAPVEKIVPSANALNALQNAVANLHRRTGAVTWRGATAPGVWSSGPNTYCARFVRMCYGKPPEFATAIDMYRYYQQRNLVHRDPNPTLGAVVFYAAHPGNGNNGHTAIADGLGNVYGAGSVINKTSLLRPGEFLGWVMPDTFVYYYGSVGRRQIAQRSL